MKKPHIWKLKPKMDRRFNMGHPWVYSNELEGSPKGILPGALIELQDPKGQFLAYGIGNPGSLISFRALTRQNDEGLLSDEGISREWLKKHLYECWSLRASLGLDRASFRWCFGEADGLPGLVIDAYRLSSGAWVIVDQEHTAGMDVAKPQIDWAIEEVLKKVGIEAFARVRRNDIGVRKLEGVPVAEPELLREEPKAKLTAQTLPSSLIEVRSALGTKNLVLEADLLEGQKTGFFLDQVGNTEQVIRLAEPWLKANGRKALKVLDLCCYVGQWGTQWARAARELGLELQVTLVDVSKEALARAQSNVARELGEDAVKVLQADVLKELGELPDGGFDIVVSDPPALIKSRKDLGPGTHAYGQLHTQALRLTRAGGIWVACSCSALLSEEEFMGTLAKAERRLHTRMRWLGRGGQAPDHPVSATFGEGRYLKAWVGIKG